MAAIRAFNAAPEADELRRRVYAGDILIVRGVAAVQRLVSHFDAALRRAFAPHFPPSAQFSMDGETWAARAASLRDHYRRDTRARQWMVEMYREFGLEPDRTAADVVNLRCQPHSDAPEPDDRHTLSAHRDTWASNVYQQINWWLPIYPLSPGRTIAFLPYHWEVPIDNESADWDLDAIRDEVRAARQEGRVPAIRNVPAPRAAPDDAHMLPVVPEPGDVLIFSGAHLHASVPNDSGAARFSLEMRSIDLVDAARGAAAPNVDGFAPRVAWHWFRRLDTGERLAREGAPGTARTTR